MSLHSAPTQWLQRPLISLGCLVGRVPRQWSLAHWFGIEFPWAAAQLENVSLWITVKKKRRRKKHKAAIACRECQITGWNTRWNKKHRWSMWYNTFAYFFYLFFNHSSKEFLNKSGLLVTSQSIGFLWYMCIHFFVYTYFCSIDYVVHLSGVMRKKKTHMQN